MLLNKVLFASLPLFIVSFATHGQKLKSSTQEFRWSMARLSSDAGADHKHRLKHEFDKYVLPVSEKERIIPVAGSKTWGIVRINEDGKVLWQFEGLSDELIGIGLIGSDVIAFSAPDAEKPRKVEAILINGTKGNKVAEKTVYEPSSPAKTQIKVQNKMNGAFNDLMVITDDRKEGVSIGVIYLTAELGISKQVTLKPGAGFVRFAGSLVSDDEEIVVGDFSENQFIVSRFNKEGKEIKKSSADLVRRSDDFRSILQFDKNNAKTVVAAINYKTESKDWANQVIRFDLDGGATRSAKSEVLDKDYSRSVSLERIRGTMDGNLKWIDEAEIAGMVQWQDKIVLIKEIRTSVSSDKNTRYVNHAWVASIYDGDLNVRKTIGIDKKYESFRTSSLSLGFNLQKDRLVIVSPALAGLGTSTLTFVSLNLASETIEKAVTMDELKAFGNSPVEAGATIWFDNKFLLQQLKGGGSFMNMNQSSNCVLHKVEL